MKKGFTMIELIFVIVILGVLAAVAIPKLNATRDDAEQAKAMTNLATLMGDLTSYYTAQGSFADNITSMTNVPLKEVKESSKADNYGADVLTTKYYSFEIKNKPCVGFKVNGASLEIASAASVDGNPVCKNILGNTATQNILSGNYTCAAKLEAQTDGASGAKWKEGYAATDTDAALKKACGTAANEYSTTHTPASQTDKVDIFVPTKIDKAGKKVSVSFEGAGVKF